MKQKNDRTTRYGISHFGCNLEDWELNMDLDLTWTGIIRSLIMLILKKLRSFPRPIRKGLAVVKQG